MNWEEIFAKLTVGRTDFYVAPPRTVRMPIGAIFYFTQEGTVTKKNDLPQLESKISNEIIKLKVGDFTPPFGPEDWHLKCYELYLENNDNAAIDRDVNALLGWTPFEYSVAK